ncbi:TRAP transporter small permease [Seohaeicola zhoushanensis]|uniref:TRAP transporter small permease protein n=1 Tax=Seohaeicola zhoushanensis TaxID=1569283 RepID=A0A8J3M7I4_9RHOB|nr:TRAP transporter small permease [Seohaeicola zhoushanensis]GHF52893.1 C4-dicarboxylate ABC transporter [Seohaeicola zhoushanensis]
MRKTMETAAIATGRLANIALWVAGAGLVAMTVMIAAQVFWRYVLNNSIVWSEPASVMVMGWFIFLGAAVGIREGYHLSFDVLLYVVPDAVKKLFHTLSDIMVAAFGGGMVFYGWQLAERAAHVQLPSLGISGAFDFAPIVGGGVLVVLFSLERILRRLAGLHTSRFGDTETAEA